MDIVSLLIQLASGALGGNIAGSVLKNMSLGTLGNTLAGIIGGGLGGQILERAIGLGPAAAGAGLDLGAIISQVLTQLAGWKPGEDHGELHRINAPGPDRREGFAYYPLGFKSTIVTG